MPKWEPWNGALRAAGEGPIGIHHGSCVWTMEAAKHRRESLGNTVARSWIEQYDVETHGWKRVSEVVHTTEPVVVDASLDGGLQNRLDKPTAAR